MVTLQESYVNQGFYLGLESSYATKVAANKRILSATAPYGIEIATEPFTPSGDTAPSVIEINDEYTMIDATGKADFQAFPYFAASVIEGGVTPTNPAGTVQNWLFSYDGRTPLAPDSFSTIYGSTNRAREADGMVWTAYNMSINRQGVDFGASGIAKELTTGSVAFPRNEQQTLTQVGGATGGTFTLTFESQETAGIAFDATAAAIETALELLSTINDVVCTGGPINTTPVVVEFSGNEANEDVALMVSDPALLTGGSGMDVVVTETRIGGTVTEISPTIVFPGHFDVYMDDSWANLGTTKLLYCYEFGLEWADRIARTLPINSTKTSDSLVETEDQQVTCNLTLGVDATSEALIADLRAGTRKFVRLVATGAEIETGYSYIIQHDLSLFLSDVDSYQASDNVHVLPMTAIVSRDPTSSKALELTVQNTLTAL